MKKIFVASQHLNLGDILLETPVFRAIKETYPDCKVIMMAAPPAREILKGHPFIDELIIYSKKDSPITALKYIKKIWHFDLALILDHSYRNGLFAKLAGIPMRIGQSDKKGDKPCLTYEVLPPKSRVPLYEAEKFLNIARVADITTDNYSLSMAPAKESEKAKVHQLLTQNNINDTDNFIVIAPYSLSNLKNWPEKNYQVIIDFLQSKNYKVILVSGKENRERAEFFNGCYNFAGLTNIREMTYLISLSQLIICGCTSALHFASTTPTKIIALYGPTSSEQWAPKKNCTVISCNYPCSPCFPFGNTCNINKCITSISPERVCQEIARTLYPCGNLGTLPF